jgi:DNA-binding response OmpR family regulator
VTTHISGKHRILLVDDEPGILATLRLLLETRDLEVITASSGEGASQLLQTKHFDLVITDMKMQSDAAGYTVVQAARESPNHPPTIIISGWSYLASDWEACGAAAMLTKPTNTPELLATVEGLLARPKEPRPRSEPRKPA